jgi:hypothetical protein
VINTSRSERGWRGRRRIAVLVSVVGVLGIAALGSASTASASNVGNCKAKLVPKGSARGTSATLKWTCDATTRAYTIGANKKIKGFSAPRAGAATSFLTCSGSGVGFGCGVPDRAAPGTQPPGTTGWTSPVPPYPGATATPLTCGGFTRISSTPVNRNGIVGAPCTEVIAGGTLVTQNIKLAASPCSSGKDPLQLYLFVGGEPPVTSFTTGGDSTTVGEFVTEPIPVSLKAYRGKSCRGGGAQTSSSATQAAGGNNFPVSCSGSIRPATTPGDQKLSFSCDQTIRGWALYSNKTIDLPGDEPIVSGTAGGGANEGALEQCSGIFPGAGFGCGQVDRQTQTALLPNGNALSGGNTAEQTIGFDSTPCQRKGQPKTKAWLVAIGEPVIGNSAGEYTSAPQSIGVSGFGKCKDGKKK